MSYKFQGCVYHSRDEMLDAIAYEWLSGDGLFDGDVQRQLLVTASDEALADLCISARELDRSAYAGYGEEIASHMDEYGYSEEGVGRSLFAAARRDAR